MSYCTKVWNPCPMSNCTKVWNPCPMSNCTNVCQVEEFAL